ncbi:hypothetical protein SBC1_49350 (plasmid) [Caballeronia sp. SBC1]|nr:hypothetical protein SBC2_38620 [Caballeronia sp. SBC2]QIN64895.1 hypothetical protein SBC1_49350 [Caballeronia sp. SBC1]
MIYVWKFLGAERGMADARSPLTAANKLDVEERFNA